jgi:hypothetical protein
MTDQEIEISKIAIFRQKEIRKVTYKNEWWFSVVDVVQVLTNQPSYLTARKYWNKLSQRLKEEGSEVVTKCHRLKLRSADGKMRETDSANTETLFRLVQSIPSPKAEPFKRWLAKAGYERVQEIEDPELAQKRARAIYKSKGYPDNWIERRMRGIAIREELTDEWQKHGVQRPRDYEILTAEISKATFGITPSEYKKLKGLKRENLRDHMDDLEMLFSQLGEAATTEITKTENPIGFGENKLVSKRGGKIAGDARKKLEKETGRKVTTPKNYLPVKNIKKLK